MGDQRDPRFSDPLADYDIEFANGFNFFEEEQLRLDYEGDTFEYTISP